MQQEKKVKAQMEKISVREKTVESVEECKVASQKVSQPVVDNKL